MKMTKNRVKSKVNNLIKAYTEKLKIEIENILKDADMWYGYMDSIRDAIGFSIDDHNGDMFALDGELDDSVDIWLHTRKELGF